MQGLKALKAWQDETHIQFSYSGPDGYVGLEGYALDYIPLPSTDNNPEPLFSPAFYPPDGDYIISAHTLNGLSLTDSDNYAWFRYHQPDDIIAHVLFYYHIESPAAPAWLAQCQQPVPPLTEQAIATGFGKLNPRRAVFDCTQAWLYPLGTSDLGWYALHGQLLHPESLVDRLYPHAPQPKDDFTAGHLKSIPLGYRRYTYQRLPAFALYEWEHRLTPKPELAEHYAAPAPTPPNTFGSTLPTKTPSPLSGPLAFLGMSTQNVDDGLEISTWWRVTEGPIERPLSLMAHLITATGEALEVADGLGVPPATWQAGDIIVQRHRFTQHAANNWLRTGAYWLDDGTRWSIAGQQGADALFVPLEADP